MSLDITLVIEDDYACPTGDIIFIRVGGETRRASKEELAKMFPGRWPVMQPGGPCRVHEANITHNLVPMAKAAGLYDCLWCVPDNGLETAGQLVEPLRRGLDLLRADPDRFKALNPPNGWGDYDGFCGFVEKLLAACDRWPDARIEVSR